MENELPDWAMEMAVELVDSDQFKGLMAVDRIGKCSEMVARALVSASQRETANLISIIADIREKSGVGVKPMLGDLADAIAAEMGERERRGIEKAAKVAEGSRSIAQNKWAEGYNEASENIAADIRQIGGEE